MEVRAKVACAQQYSCSGVVETPKRRGQNKVYGPWFYTEREWILCGYPLATKATDDTFLLKKRGK